MIQCCGRWSSTEHSSFTEITNEDCIIGSCCLATDKNSAAIQKVLGQRFTLSLSLFIDCLMGGQAEQVKGNLIDQVHRKCSTSKWMMNVDFSLLSWECIIHFHSFALFFANINSDWSHLPWLKVTRVSKLCCLSLSSVFFFYLTFFMFSSNCRLKVLFW